MAPLNPNNTERWCFDYINAVHPHCVMIRTPDDSTIEDVEALLGGIVGAVGAAFSESTWIGVRRADKGSDIFLPMGGSSLVGSAFGAGAANKETDATCMKFVGNSVAGRRTSLGLFGYKNPLSDFRITASEAASIATAVGLLNDAASIDRAIDGLSTVWKAYANVKTNDHWVKLAR